MISEIKKTFLDSIYEVKIFVIIEFQIINNLIGLFGHACTLFACITEPKEEKLLNYTAGDKMGKRDSINVNTDV